MAIGIRLKEHRYVLEGDRAKPKAEQSIFVIKPKTVDASADTAARYAKITVSKRGGRKTDVDVDAYRRAEKLEWLEAVQRVENYYVPLDAPAGPHFKEKAESDSDNFEFAEYEGVQCVRVVSADNKDDLLGIFQSMDIKETEEIFRAATDYSELRAGEILE